MRHDSIVTVTEWGLWLQAHPQSWRFTCVTFNCLLLVAAALFLACLTTATPAATPRAAGGGGAGSREAAAAARSSGSAGHSAARRVRVPRNGAPHPVLETVEECDPLLELRSNASSIRSLDSGGPKPG